MVFALAALALMVGSGTVVTQIQFLAGPAAANSSSFVAIPAAATADGISPIALVLVAKDVYNNPVANAAVALTASGTGNTLDAALGTTDADGAFHTTLRSTTAETKVLTAVVGITARLVAQAIFLPGPMAPARCSLVVSPNTTVANNSNTLVAWVTLQDASGNPIPGYMPVFSTSGASTAVASAGATGTDGRTSATYRTAVAQNENAVVTVDAWTYAAPITFVAGPINQQASNLTASPNVLPADGVSRSTLVVTAKDALGNAFGGATVALTASGSSHAFGAASGVTNASGAFSTTMTSSLAQGQTVTATIGGVVLQGTPITFTPVVNTATSSLSVTPSRQTVGPANGIVATLTLKDAQANPLANVMPAWTASGRNTTIVPSGSTDATGTAQAIYTTTLAQNQNAEVTAGGATLVMPMTFVSGSPNQTISSMFIKPARQMANNGNVITAYAQLADAYGNPITNQSVSFTASGWSTSIAQSGNTDVTGLAWATYRTSLTQNENAIATSANVSLTRPIIFTATPVACTLSVSPPSVVADGNTAITLKATVYQNLLSGLTAPNLIVTFSTAGGATGLSPKFAMTSALGVATSTVTSRISGINTFYASTNGVQCTAKGSFSYRPAYCTASPNYLVRSMPIASPTGLATGDLNGDGIVDIVASAAVGGVWVAQGRGDGTFGRPVFWPAAGSSASSNNTFGIAVGDYDGDGNLDVVQPLSSQSSINTYLGSANGVLTAGQLAAPPSTSITLLDIDLDGTQDLLTGSINDATLGIFFGASNGRFLPLTRVAAVSFPSNAVGVGDFNADGVYDVALPSYDTGRVGILLGTAPGQFGHVNLYPSSSSAVACAVVADLDGDGRQDVITGGANNPNIDLFFGAGNGNFTLRQTLVAAGASPAVAVDDLNGDGIPDIVSPNATSGGPSLFLGKGLGDFSVPTEYAGTGGGYGIVTADFNGDGKRDFAVAFNGNNVVSVYLYQGCP